MKRILAVALLALGLVGCAHQWPDLRAIDPNRPRIYITQDDLLVVDQEPIILSLSGDRKVTWQLPKGMKALFGKGDGITVDDLVKIEGPDGKLVGEGKQFEQARNAFREAKSRRAILFACSPETELTFTCVVSKDIHKGLYSYTIRATVNGKPVQLDPTIMPRS
jgi:hypothetical protein